MVAAIIAQLRGVRGGVGNRHPLWPVRYTWPSGCEAVSLALAEWGEILHFRVPKDASVKQLRDGS